jgi:hypothetical protein
MLKKGFHHSEETKKKIGEKNKINPNCLKNLVGNFRFPKGHIPWNKGKHHSEETKRKLSLAGLGHHHSEETKNKIRKTIKEKGINAGKNNHFWKDGRSSDKEYIKKCGREWFLKNFVPVPPDIARKHRIDSHKGKFWGKDTPNWKGGTTKVNFIIRYSSYMKEWKMSVLKRDNYTCQKCGKKSGDLNIHHIISLSSLIRKYKIKNCQESLKYKEVYDINNGITLCKDCHRLTDNYGRKEANKIDGLIDINFIVKPIDIQVLGESPRGPEQVK